MPTPTFKDVTVPADGQPITISQGKLTVPDRPIIPFVEGDGTGPDIWRASVRVFDAAVAKAYGGKRKIVWHEVLAGQKAFDQLGTWLPADTVEAFKTYRVGIKGPLTTPVGVGCKPVSQPGSERLVQTAIGYAVQHKRRSVTLVQKGNMMKFAEGAFRDWG